MYLDTSIYVETSGSCSHSFSSFCFSSFSSSSSSYNHGPGRRNGSLPPHLQLTHQAPTAWRLGLALGFDAHGILNFGTIKWFGSELSLKNISKPYLHFVKIVSTGILIVPDKDVQKVLEDIIINIVSCTSLTITVCIGLALASLLIDYFYLLMMTLRQWKSIQWTSCVMGTSKPGYRRAGSLGHSQQCGWNPVFCSLHSYADTPDRTKHYAKLQSSTEVWPLPMFREVYKRESRGKLPPFCARGKHYDHQQIDVPISSLKLYAYKIIHVINCYQHH